MTTKEIFNDVYNGQPNIMTPNIEGYYKKGNLHIEISSGQSIFGSGQIFGVTVIEDTGEEFKRRPDISVSFCEGSDRLGQAQRYKDSL